MAYTLEQIYEALGKIENGGTMVADLQDAIRGARDEAAKNRIEKNKILDQLNLRQSGDTDGKAINPAEMSKILIGNVSVGDGDKIVYKDGDKEVSVTDGVSSWLKANPWAVKADVQTGAGGGSGSQGSGGAKYTMNDLKTMSRDEINAHWDEISKGVVAEADKK